MNHWIEQRTKRIAWETMLAYSLEGRAFRPEKVAYLRQHFKQVVELNPRLWRSIRITHNDEVN